MAIFDIADRNEARAGVDSDTLVRTLLFFSVFPLVWISLHPFTSLAEAPAPTSEGGDLLNQIAFSGMFLIFAAWVMLIQPSGLKPLLRPVFVIMIAWFALSVALSWEPALAARRLAFAMIMLSLSAVTLLLPKNLRHFTDLLGAATFLVLLLCYFGVIFMPENAIHQATDYLEPEHAGSWRGVFPHKNQAGGIMVVYFFIGLFVARVRSRGFGALIAVLALVFLVFTRSKTPIGFLPLAMVVSMVVTRARRLWVGLGMALGTLVLLNLVTVGSVYFEGVRHLLEDVMADPSFTGRADIWEFALNQLAARPVTGYGFGAFWGTEQVVFGIGRSTWATAATDAHNSYLNLALTTGLPGLLLAVVWVAVLPIRDYYRRGPDEGSRWLSLLFVRVVIFGIYTSCFEGTLFQQAGELWFMIALSVFGLRYLAVSQVNV